MHGDDGVELKLPDEGGKRLRRSYYGTNYGDRYPDL
jgi:hypothetical protein